jgi:hypothetical protein
VVSNQVTVSHRWNSAGEYAVVARAFSAAVPAGVSSSLVVQVVDGVHYVALDSSNPQPPYQSWATAARTIQDAVDAVTVVGARVLVSTGVYQTGGKLVDGPQTNRVAITTPLLLLSVNGPRATIIRGFQVPGTTNGYGAVRCVYLGDGAFLSGFTLSDGAGERGGGVLCESVNTTVSNCIMQGNLALMGGGAYSGTLYSCGFVGNSAD